MTEAAAALPAVAAGAGAAAKASIVMEDFSVVPLLNPEQAHHLELQADEYKAAWAAKCAARKAGGCRGVAGMARGEQREKEDLDARGERDGQCHLHSPGSIAVLSS